MELAIWIVAIWAFCSLAFLSLFLIGGFRSWLHETRVDRMTRRAQERCDHKGSIAGRIDPHYRLCPWCGATLKVVGE